MVGFGGKEIAKEKFYAAKKPIKIQDVNIYNIVFSKLILKTNSKTNSMYSIEINFDKAIKPLVSIMPEKVDMLRHLKKVTLN